LPDVWENINNNNNNRSYSSRTSSVGGGCGDVSPGSARRSSSPRQNGGGGPASMSEEDDLSTSSSSFSCWTHASSSSLKLPETIRKSLGKLEDLAHEIQLLTSDLSAIVDEGHQILDWSTFHPSHHNDNDDDRKMSLSSTSQCTSTTTSATTTKDDDNNRQQQLMVQQRLGVLDSCARTGAEQASKAYMAYLTTVRQLNLAIDLEVREYILYT
jgi:hypothetical protein